MMSTTQAAPTVAAPPHASAATAPTPAPTLAVRGSWLVDQGGHPRVLQGVNRVGGGWTPASVGTRYLQVGVFSTDWKKTYDYNKGALTFKVVS